MQVSATAGPDESAEVDPLVVSDVAAAAPALPPPPPPAHQPNQPPAPGPGNPRPAAFGPTNGRFPGFDTFYYGFINPYPMPPLPAFPLIILLPVAPMPIATRPTTRANILALPWHPDTPTGPLCLNLNTPALSEQGATPTRRRRRPRKAIPAPTRHSSRLARKEPDTYVAVESKATMLKTLKNELATCSTSFQQQVNKRGVLKHARLPLPVPDLRKIASTAMGTLALSEPNRVLRAANAKAPPVCAAPP